MIYPGLVSVTFRQLTAAEVVALAKKARMVGIEWGGDLHVPAGDLVTAREVRELTEQAGLRVAAYGSYYRAGGGENDDMSFARVLDTAIELGAPTIRVWAGGAGSADLSEAARWRIIEDIRRICTLAAAHGVSVALEFHGGTLTDTNESAVRLLLEVDHPNCRMYWQPHNGQPTARCVEGLSAILPSLGNVHVFHWWPTAAERHLLSDGAERWASFWPLIHKAPGDRFALLEFVQGDSPEAFLKDAETLNSWLNELILV